MDRDHSRHVRMKGTEIRILAGNIEGDAPATAPLERAGIPGAILGRGRVWREIGIGPGNAVTRDDLDLRGIEGETGDAHLDLVRAVMGRHTSRRSGQGQGCAHAPCLANPFGLDTTPGAAVGLLGIDLSTRQRVRVNGGFIDQTSTGLMVHVDQAFGNCPQYIQSREFDTSQGGRRPIVERADSGSTAIRQIIDNADTFFIASRGPGVADGIGPTLDASHRGGRPGFLRMDANGKLSFPDFRGNRFFNTLGNIEADGRVGLFVPDFATGAAALVTGRAAVDWQADRIGTFAGAERIVDVICDEVWHVADR